MAFLGVFLPSRPMKMKFYDFFLNHILFIDPQYAGNLASIFDRVFGLLGDLVNAIEKIPDHVKRSSTNLIPNQSVLMQLGNLNVPEVHRTYDPKCQV